MYSFLLSVLALVLGYFVYGRFIARVFGPDPKRPHLTDRLWFKDEVDYKTGMNYVAVLAAHNPVMVIAFILIRENKRKRIFH